MGLTDSLSVPPHRKALLPAQVLVLVLVLVGLVLALLLIPVPALMVLRASGPFQAHT